MTHCFRLSNVPDGATLRLTPETRSGKSEFNKELFISNVITSDHYFVFKIYPLITYKLFQYKQGYYSINLILIAGEDGGITDIQMPPMSAVDTIDDLQVELDRLKKEKVKKIYTEGDAIMDNILLEYLDKITPDRWK